MGSKFVLYSFILLFAFGCVSTPKTQPNEVRVPAQDSPRTPHEAMAVIGDVGLAGPGLNALNGSISREKITSLILPGDNVYFGSYKSIWNSWKREGYKFDVVAIGNHNKGYAEEIKYFGMPGEFYAVVKNGARFLVLNSDNQNNLDEQFTWLNKELDEAKEPLIFLVYHHPTFSTGSDDRWQQKEFFQLKMREVFKTKGHRIAAVLLGHAHISAAFTYGSLPAIVSGSGQESLKVNRVSYVEDDTQVQTRYLAPRVNYWAKLVIGENSTDAWVHFIRVEDQTIGCSIHIGQGHQMTLDQNCPALQ